jgi:hypothetical protein
MEEARSHRFVKRARLQSGRKTPQKRGWALHAAEKLNQPRISQGLVTGHDFSRADKANQIDVGLQPLRDRI